MSFNFADDSTLLASSTSIINMNIKLNDDMNLVSDWVNGNLMTLNCKKTKSMKMYSMRNLMILIGLKLKQIIKR